MAEYELPPEFRDAVAELVFHSQMLEWMLRVYLSDVYYAADDALGAKGIRFKSRVSDFEKHTLGRLVELFVAHSDNDGLATRLRAFTKHRNDAAHTFFVLGWFHREDPEVIARALAHVLEHVEEAKALEHVITLESMRIFQLRSGLASLAEREAQ